MMFRRIIFSVIWSVVFAFGSAFIVGICSGILFFGIAMTGSGDEIDSDGWLPRIIGVGSLVVSWTMGLVGLVLGLLGKLPGTRPKRIRQAEDPRADYGTPFDEKQLKQKD